MKPVPVLLVLSLAANAGLLFGLVRRECATGRTIQPPPAARPAPAPSPAAPPDLPTLAPAALRDELTRLGLPAAAVEALVRARIFARHDVRRRELIVEAANSPQWWRAAWLRIDPLRVLTSAQRKELRDLETAARDEALALLGPAALDRDGTLAYRYRYVPPEKAVLLDALERDYRNLGAELDEASRWFRTPGDLEHKKLLATERDRDLAAMLTPQEREIYELRESRTRSNNNFQQRVPAFEPTEAEYRAVFALHKAFDDKFPQWRGGPVSNEDGAIFFGALNQLQEDIHTALGDARYEDWKLAGRQYYGELLGLAAANQLPPETVKQVAGIVTATINGSWRIATDAILTGPQKKAALAELVAAARAQVAGKMGPDLAAAYLKNPATYFDTMTSGSAVMLRDAVGMMIGPVDTSRFPPPSPAPKK